MNTFISSTKKETGLVNQNVLADYGQAFYNSLKMSAYPTFLIIENQEGKIIYMSIGYNEIRKNMLIEKLKGISIE